MNDESESMFFFLNLVPRLPDATGHHPQLRIMLSRLGILPPGPLQPLTGLLWHPEALLAVNSIQSRQPRFSFAILGS